MVEETENSDNLISSSGHSQLQPTTELRGTQVQGFYSYRAEQWNRITWNGNAMFPWHTLCLVVDLLAMAFLFVYGWLRSSAPWPFIIPAVGYVVNDVGFVAVFVALGPVPVISSTWQAIVGQLQGMQQVFCTLAAVLLPVQQKPFQSVWPMLVGCTVMGFVTRTLATMSLADVLNPKCVKFEVLRHGVLGGCIAAIRTLDSLTDLQVGSLLVQQARDAVCTWKGEEASCGPITALATAQLVMAFAEFFIGAYLQQNDLKLASKKAITRKKLAVHLTSLLCEVGMMAIYIISSTHLRAVGHDISGSSSSLNDATSTEAILFIIFSLCLTVTVFFANLYGLGRMMLGVARATSKVRNSIASAVTRSRMSSVGELSAITPRTPKPPQQRPANAREGRICWSASTKNGEAPTELQMDLDVLEDQP